MQKYLSKCFNKMHTQKFLISICQKPSGMELNSPQLTIYIKLITETFDFPLKKCQPQYFISTEVDRNATGRQMSSGTHVVHQQRHIPSGKNKLERDFKISKHHLISQREN